MSNEVNISVVSTASADPNVEWFIWRAGIQPQKARFFTVVSYAGLIILGEPLGPIDFEITRVWSTEWVSAQGDTTHQWNVNVRNVGNESGLYALVMAETDN